jgi:hypothetical protein
MPRAHCMYCSLATWASRNLGSWHPPLILLTLPSEVSIARERIWCTCLFYRFMISSTSRGRPGRGRGGGGRGRGSSDHHDRGHGRGRGGVPPINRAVVPKGKCTFYWSSGACQRGFDCTFRHEARPGAQVSSSATQSIDYTPDFFSPEGLAINNGSIVDSQHNLRPSEAHNHLKPYLSDNFVFRDAIHVEGFSRILASVNSRNQTWVPNSATVLLLSDEFARNRIPTKPRSVNYPDLRCLPLIRCSAVKRASSTPSFMYALYSSESAFSSNHALIVPRVTRYCESVTFCDFHRLL